MTRIIAEADGHGGWSAWLEGRAYQARGGDTAATAVMRLLQAHGRSVSLIEPDHDATGLWPQAFRLNARCALDAAITPCNNCGGGGSN